jgi:hypothetical protein
MRTHARPGDRIVLAAAAAALVALTVAGCGASDDAPRPATSGTSGATEPAASGYVSQINELCADLKQKVLAVYGTGGHGAHFPIAVFEKEQRQLVKVIADFDAAADAVPVTDADQSAAAAFEAYRQLSDEGQRMLATAAASGKQARFDAAFSEVHAMIDASSVPDDLQLEGIVCNAR